MAHPPANQVLGNTGRSTVACEAVAEGMPSLDDRPLSIRECTVQVVVGFVGSHWEDLSPFGFASDDFGRLREEVVAARMF